MSEIHFVGKTRYEDLNFRKRNYEVLRISSKTYVTSFLQWLSPIIPILKQSQTGAGVRVCMFHMYVLLLSLSNICFRILLVMFFFSHFRYKVFMLFFQRNSSPLLSNISLQLFLCYPRHCSSPKYDISHRLTCRGWTGVRTVSHLQVIFSSYPWCSAARASSVTNTN